MFGDENKTLIQVERELLEKLDAVRLLMGQPKKAISADEPNVTNKREVQHHALKPDLTIPGKGDLSWKHYILSALNQFKVAKSNDIANAMINANPDIERDTVIDAVKSHLSKMGMSGEIYAIKSANRKEGYTYKPKE